jgi:hypothetical protein
MFNEIGRSRKGVEGFPNTLRYSQNAERQHLHQNPHNGRATVNGTKQPARISGVIGCDKRVLSTNEQDLSHS